MPPPSTIEDVARRAGVSVATVSRALRGLDNVRAQTRERVLQAAADLEYVVSPTAASLASGRTRVVGVVTPFTTRWFFANVISAIEKALREYAHLVLLIDLEESPRTRRPLERGMVDKRIDALIILNVLMSDAEHDLLTALGLPVVTLGYAAPGWPYVGIDDAETTALATEHLVSLGHTRIAFVGAVDPDNAHRQTPMDRLRGFVETIASHGLTTATGWIVYADWTAGGAYDATATLLDSTDRPTGVVAASDDMAIGVVARATRVGLRVPEDLSVVGIDDHELAPVLGITSVRQDVAAQGRAAAAAVLAALGYSPANQRVPDLGTHLVKRESTGPVPRRGEC